MLTVTKNIFDFLKKTRCLQVLRHTSTRSPETVFIEKTLEDPVIVIDEHDNIDIIGPPDSLSNIRPIIRKQLINGTPLQQKLRKTQETTQSWNQLFWSNHNTKFLKERQAYIDAHQITGQEKRLLSADEMSEFYKQFLDENWRIHLKYNAEWYKKNFTLLFLSLGVSIEQNLLTNMFKVS